MKRSKDMVVPERDFQFGRPVFRVNCGWCGEVILRGKSSHGRVFKCHDCKQKALKEKYIEKKSRM